MGGISDEGKAPKAMKPIGAQFEISIDGTPRTCRDLKALAIEAAEQLKKRNPHSEVTVKDLVSGESTVVAFKPERS